MLSITAQHDILAEVSEVSEVGWHFCFLHFKTYLCTLSPREQHILEWSPCLTMCRGLGIYIRVLNQNTVICLFVCFY